MWLQKPTCIGSGVLNCRNLHKSSRKLKMHLPKLDNWHNQAIYGSIDERNYSHEKFSLHEISLLPLVWERFKSKLAELILGSIFGKISKYLLWRTFFDFLPFNLNVWANPVNQLMFLAIKNVFEFRCLLQYADMLQFICCIRLRSALMFIHITHRDKR